MSKKTKKSNKAKVVKNTTMPNVLTNVKPTSYSYLVVAPSGQAVLINNEGITNNGAKALALPIFRAEDANWKRDDLKARKVPVYVLSK